MPNAPADPCWFLTGAMKTDCEKAQSLAVNGGSGAGVLGNILSSPGSEWWRHAVLRVVEVVVGTAMIIAGVRALTRGSETVNVITQGARKVGKKL